MVGYPEYTKCASIALGVFLLAATSARPAVVVSQGDGDWGAGGTWSPGVPGPADDVFIRAGDTVTITGVNEIAISSLSVTGRLTHADNSTTEAHKIDLDVAGDVTVDASGSIDASGLGYRYDRYPGGAMITGDYGMGGSHGGHGGKNWGAGGNYPYDTYGSVIAPTNIGAGGRGFTSPRNTDGGGAIKLSVGETLHVSGEIRADGIGNNLQLNGGGAGGSVWLTVSNLTGSGTISAIGGDGTEPSNNGASGGGGGRIAVILTDSESFGGVTIQAFGGDGYIQDGAAGTIYLQKSSQTSTSGELIVDNNDRVNSRLIYTGFAPDRVFDSTTDLDGTASASYTFSRVTVTNAGDLRIGSDDSVTMTAGGEIVGDATDDNDGVRVAGGSLITTDASFTYSNCFIAIDASGSSFSPGTALTVATNASLIVNAPHTIAGNVTLASGSTITHNDQAQDELFKIDLTIDGDLTIPAGCAVNVNGLGYDTEQGPGKSPNPHRAGGSHGGRGGKGGSEGYEGGPTYGSIISPTNIGSGGAVSSGNASGGGAIKLTVSGATTLDGEISADGVNTNGNASGGGAGGSVWLTTSNLTGNGTISADGGRGENNNPAGPGGGGGRVAVILTGSDSFSSVAIQAYGGVYETPSTLYDGAAGTVYKQTLTQGANKGTLLVDNNGEVSRVETEIGSSVTDAEVGDVIIRNAAHFQLNDNQSITVNGSWSNGYAFTAGTDSTVELAGTNAATVYGNNTFQALVMTGLTKQVTFEAGATQDVDNVFSLAGTSGNTGLVLRSTSPGTAWFLDVDAGADISVSYVDAQDSNADPGTAIVASHSEDSGNNSNWVFKVAGGTNVWIGPTSTDWGDVSNWTLGPPTLDDVKLVISNGTFDPIMPTPQTVNNLEIWPGATLHLNTNDLTVHGETQIAGTMLAAGSETITFSNLTVSGAVTLVGTETIYIAGDVDLTDGTFTKANSHVILNGTVTQTVTSDGESFSTLTTSNQSALVTFADTVVASYYFSRSANVTYGSNFAAMEFHVYSDGGAITQTFNAGSTYAFAEFWPNGSTGKVVHLESSSSSAWNLNVSKVAQVSWVDVEYSDASGGVEIMALSSTDSGNNVNWNFGPFSTWVGGISTDFDDADNWSPVGVPDASTRIFVDSAVTLNVDDPAAVMFARIGGLNASKMEVHSSFTAVSNVEIIANGTLEINDDPGMTVSNDMVVGNGGTVTHADHTTVQTDKLMLTVIGNLAVAAGGAIDASGMGYRYNRFPGGEMAGGFTALGMGGSHGGHGGKNWGNGYLHPYDTYGSVIAPTNLGAGGKGFTSPFITDGGGAIRLTVGKTLHVAGEIRADGLGNNLQLNGGGAGGSIWLTVSNLTGSGTISASGGDGTEPSNNGASGGGGGRVAVILTASETFGGVTIQARGGDGYIQDGAAGTVYLQKSSQTSTNGELIVDNSGRVNSRILATALAPDEVFDSTTDVNGTDSASYTFSKITVTNAGDLRIGPDDSVTLTAGGAIIGDPADDSEGIRVAGGSLIITDATFAFTNTFIAIDTNGSVFSPGAALTVATNASLIVNAAHTITGNVTVAAGGTIAHNDQSDDELFKIDLTIDGDLSIATGGAVDVDGLGHATERGPGTSPSPYRAGGSYGGRGGKGAPEGYEGGPTYGSILSPASLGSGGAVSSGGDCSGGGAVKLTVSGATTLSGEITADGINTNGNAAGGGAGGSVWLTTASLSGSGTISADGGRGENNNPAGPGGGGGRISVILTGSDSFGSVAMQAYGGVYETPSDLYDGAAGTVYRQTLTQGAGGGRMIVDNNGEVSRVATYLPPESGGLTNELFDATVIVTNANSDLTLSTNIYVGDLLVYTNVNLALGSYTMYVDTSEHHLDSLGSIGTGGPTNAVDFYDQIVWLGGPPGAVIFIR